MKKKYIKLQGRKKYLIYFHNMLLQFICYNLQVSKYNNLIR